MLFNELPRLTPVVPALVTPPADPQLLPPSFSFSQEIAAEESVHTCMAQWAASLVFDAEIAQELVTLDELTTLHQTIKTHGLTASLLAFVNKNNILTHAIPAIPAVESFAADLPAAQCAVALEGIFSKIGEIMSNTVSRITTHFEKMAEESRFKKGDIETIRHRLDQYVAEVQDKPYDEAEARRVHTKLARYPILLQSLDLPLVANKIAIELFGLKLPITDVQHEEWSRKFDHVVAQHIGHLTFVHGNDIYVPSATNLSFHDAGYTEKSFQELHAKIEVVLQEQLSSNDRVDHAGTEMGREVRSMLDHLSVTYEKDGENGNKESVTEYSAAGHILYDAYRYTWRYIQHLNQVAYTECAMRAIRTLGALTHLYKHAVTPAA